MAVSCFSKKKNGSQLSQITGLQDGRQILRRGAGVASEDSKQIGSNKLHPAQTINDGDS